MAWWNTVNGDLINTDHVVKILMYDLSYKNDWLCSCLKAKMSDGNVIVITYCDGHDAGETLFENIVGKHYYHFSYSFADVCDTKIDEIKQINQEKCDYIGKDPNMYEILDIKSAAVLNRILKECKHEEIFISFYC